MSQDEHTPGCYLTCTPWDRIYPSFGGFPYLPEAHTILASAGCVPLLWLAMFSADDLAEHTFQLPADESDQAAEPLSATVYGPLVDREKAISRLHKREALLNLIFKRNGGVSHHLSLFSKHVSTFDGDFVSIECDELAQGSTDPEAWYNTLQRALSLLDRRDFGARKPLAELSTLMLGRRFVTLEQAHSATAPDMWNFFRLLGEGWATASPWD